MKRAILVVAVFLAASTVFAASVVSESTGMVGIAGGQTARLNAVFSPPPDPERQNGDPLAVRLEFFDASGNTLTSANVRLTPGHAEALEWTVPAGAPRMEIRGAGLVPPGPCRVILSLEIYDTATGRTQIAIYPPGPCNVAR